MHDLPQNQSSPEVARLYLLDTSILSTECGSHRHARAIDAVCGTDNLAEFKRVPALKVENWLRQ